MHERKKYLRSLNKQVKKYNVDHIRDDIHLDIEETKDHCEYVTTHGRDQVE